MSDQEVAFDDWEAEAEEIVQNVKQQEQPDESKTAQESAAQCEQIQQNKEIIKEKVEPVDPQKVLLKKIEQYKNISNEKYEEYVEQIKSQGTNQQSKISNQILKNDKDFAQFAKTVAKRFNDKAAQEQLQNLDQGNILTFVEESLFLLYQQLEWKNIQGVKQKLRVVKKDRKDEQIKAKKQKQKQERLKKQQKLGEKQSESPTKEQKKPEDDIFGGAILINSKQQQDQRKNKIIKKVEAPQKQQQEDDDFM